MTRAQSLRNETALNSITPERAGGIMFDTLAYINQMQLDGSNPLLISKIYDSVASMGADSAPVSDLDGSPLRPGQLVCIVTGDPDDPDDGVVYRYDGTEGGVSSWTAVGKIGSDPYLQGHLLMGVAKLSPTPTVPPVAPAQKICYIASEAGVYDNFGGIELLDGEVALLMWDTGWTKQSIGAVSAEEFARLARYVSVIQYTEITAVSIENKRFNSDGSIQDTETTKLYTFPVTAGNQYAFSVRAATNWTLYFLAWYDQGGNYISKESYRGSSSSSTSYTKQIVTAPVAAAYAKMNVSQTYQQYLHFYDAPNVPLQDFYDAALKAADVVDNLDSDAEDKPLSAKQGKALKELAGDVTVYDKQIPIQTVESMWVQPNGNIAASTRQDIAIYAVVGGSRYYFSGNFTTGFDPYYINWFDADGNFIEHADYRGPGTQYLTEVTAPANAATCRMNVLKTRASTFALYVKKTVAKQDIFDEQQLTNILLGANANIAISPNYISDGGTFEVGTTLKTAIIKVNEGERYTVSSAGASNIRYALTTTDEQTVGSAVPVVSGTSVATLAANATAVVEIPAGCSHLVVNFSQYYWGDDFLVKKIAADPTKADRRKIRLLAIGNSYSQDALAYVPFILQAMGVKLDVEIGILMMSSSTIADHVDNFNNQAAAYTFYHYSPGASEWTNMSSRTIQWALANYRWDIIMTHQSSTNASSWDTYQPAINTLVNLLYTALAYPVRFAWMISQARPAQTNSGANWSDETILAHYNYTAQNAERVIDETAFDLVLPVGTAVQNARTIASLKALGDYAENALNTSGDGYLCPNDGVHLQEGLPCQLAAYSVILALLDALGMNEISVFGEATRVTSEWASGKSIPSPHGSYIGSTNDNCRMAQLCAIVANKHPFEVTDMNYIVNPTTEE